MKLIEKFEELDANAIIENNNKWYCFSTSFILFILKAKTKKKYEKWIKLINN